MIKLNVFTGQSLYGRGEWITLDTYGNENIALTFQVDDIRNIKNKNASYSKDFNLPATKKNNNFFEHFYDLDRYNYDYNPYKSNRIELYVDGILVLEGYMRLLSTLNKQTEISYKVVIFNDVANLIDSLGDATIAHLDLPELEHLFTQNNVIASFLGQDTSGNDVPYTYSLTNAGQMALDGGNINYQALTNYVMNIQLKYILDKIFEYSGFTYLSNFFNSTEFSRLYFDTSSIKDYGDEVDDYSIGSILIALPQPTPKIKTSSITSQIGVPIYSFGQGLTTVGTTVTVGDTNNEYNAATATFTAQNTCNLQVQITCNLSGHLPDVDNAITFYINGIANSAILMPSIGSGNVNISNATFFGNVNLNAGDVAELRFGSSLDNYQSFGLFNDPWQFGIAYSDYKVELTVSNVSTTDLVITQLGGIKLADIVKDTFTMFNLMASDKGNRIIKIEPYVDYISDKVVDWTDKIDYNEIELEAIEIPRQLKFQHAQEKNDYYHNYYLEDNGIEYGSHKIIFDVDNNEEEVIELKVFAAPFTKTLNNADITIQHLGELKDNDIQVYKNKPRLVYRYSDSVNNDLPSTVYLFSNQEAPGWATNLLYQNYPQLLPFNKLLADTSSGDYSYMFGYINPSAINQPFEQPVNTLFQRFWRDYINEKYNVDTRILKCKAKLSATDMLNLDFSKKYKVKDQHYRLNKVNYNTDKNKLSNIELIRI